MKNTTRTIHPDSQAAKSKRAQRRLHKFSELVRSYEAQWQVPVDKEVFLNLWAQARKETV